MSQRIYQTLQEQEKRADLSFKDVTFEEMVAGVRYWQLKAKTAMVNKSTGIATLKEAEGSFFKKGRPVLRFRSPAALWDMKKKEILLDKPLGYDVVLERKISSLLKTIKKADFSIFNLPKIYKKELGYWFQAKNLSWKLADEKLVCTGGIVLNKSEVTGYSQKLEGDVSLEKVVLEGEPKIVINLNQSYPITLEADSFEVLSTQDLILAKGNPRVLWGEAEVTATDLKYMQRDEILQFTDNVRINYKDIQAWGDSARYLTKNETIVLEGNARAEQAGSVLRGDKVSVSLKEKKISVLGKGKFIISEEELEKK
jgi:lipopolysaccharide transport protein LptA